MQRRVVIEHRRYMDTGNTLLDYCIALCTLQETSDLLGKFQRQLILGKFAQHPSLGLGHSMLALDNAHWHTKN